MGMNVCEGGRRMKRCHGGINYGKIGTRVGAQGCEPHG